MLLSRLLSGFAAAVIFSSVGQAAEVNTLMGTVSINKGSGYVRVSQTAYGNPGDVVIAHPGGRGEIVYVDGCREIVEPGETKRIAQDSPCRTGYAPIRAPWGMALAVGGTVGVGIYLMTKDDDKPKPKSP